MKRAILMLSSALLAVSCSSGEENATDPWAGWGGNTDGSPIVICELFVNADQADSQAKVATVVMDSLQNDLGDSVFVRVHFHWLDGLQTGGEAASRASMYTVTGMPGFVLNGQHDPNWEGAQTYAIYDGYKAIIDSLANNDPALKKIVLMAKAQLSADSSQANVYIKTSSADTLDSLTIYAAVLENGVAYSDYNNIGAFDRVFRAMGQTGVYYGGSGTEDSLFIAVPVNPVLWDVSRMTVVAWVQDKSTNRIYQAAQDDLEIQ